MRVLVTGGAGFVGSHCVELLLKCGHEVYIVDNLSTGIQRNLRFTDHTVGDVRDPIILREIFNRFQPESVIHFAASSLVAESEINPLKYYENNVAGTIALLGACLHANVKSFIFSSTCAVYGNSGSGEISERTPLSPISAYGKTKLVCENLLRAVSKSSSLKCVALRYFNAAGASMETDIGEFHLPETHLIPNLINAALGYAEEVIIHGTDYDTPDGTCIRDYVHVADLADAHIRAVEFTLENDVPFLAANLGTGAPSSVKEVVEAVEAVTNKTLKLICGSRRDGDIDKIYASNKLARDTLGWVPRLSLLEICNSAVLWHRSDTYKMLVVSSRKNR